MFRTTVIGMLLILAMLEYRFLIGKDSVFTLRKLQRELASQELGLSSTKQRNNELVAQIKNLKEHPAAIEELARYELGLVKPGEKYYQVVELIQ